MTHIHNFIPVKHDMENIQYSSLAKLFKIHCQAFEVLDHIIPPTIQCSSSGKEKAVDKEADKDKNKVTT